MIELFFLDIIKQTKNKLLLLLNYFMFAAEIMPKNFTKIVIFL